MTVIRPETTNWITNPSFETNTSGWSITGGTNARVTDLAFAGSYALELTDTGTDGVSIQTSTWITVSEGQSVYAAIRGLSRQADGEITLSIIYRDSNDLNINDEFYAEPILPLTTDPFNWTTIESIREAPAGAVKCGIFVRTSTVTGAAIGHKWLLDAAELRINQVLDGYFDGSIAGCRWVGTAHASASIRDAVTFDLYQQHDSEDVTVAYRIWSVDDNLNLDTELTQWVDGGKIAVDIEQDVKRSASFDFKDLSVLSPFVTRLKVYMEKYVENVLVANEPMGVYSIDMPDGIVEYKTRYGTVEANDITIELADSARGKQFVYAKGKNIVGNAEDRVRFGRGYKANFPEGTKTFSKTERFPAWTGDLELVNTLLEMAGFRNCYGDGNGIITTQKVKTLSQTTPRLTIRAHEVFEIVETNETDQLCNVVKVYKDNPDGAPIFAIVRNDDPGDPVSTVNMRYKAKVISDSEVDSYSEALELAKATLEEGKSFERTLKLTIVPNPYLGVYNTLDLRFVQEDGTSYSGRYWIRSWELPLGAAFMTVIVNKVMELPDDD